MKGPRTSAVTFNKVEHNIKGPPAVSEVLSTSNSITVVICTHFLKSSISRSRVRILYIFLTNDIDRLVTPLDATRVNKTILIGPFFAGLFMVGVVPHRSAVSIFGIIRCGSVRFFCLRIVRCGAVRFSPFSRSYGAVRCGLYFSKMVRCGAVRLSVEQLFPTVRLSVHRS